MAEIPELHQAKKIYHGRASFEFQAGNRFQSDGFIVCVGGHVIAECEDSECADFICEAWNGDAATEARIRELEQERARMLGALRKIRNVCISQVAADHEIVAIACSVIPPISLPLVGRGEEK